MSFTATPLPRSPYLLLPILRHFESMFLSIIQSSCCPCFYNLYQISILLSYFLLRHHNHISSPFFPQSFLSFVIFLIIFPASPSGTSSADPLCFLAINIHLRTSPLAEMFRVLLKGVNVLVRIITNAYFLFYWFL